MGVILAISVMGSSKEHFCVIILKSNNKPMRRCRLKTFSILSSGGHFVQWSRTILPCLVKGHQTNISVKPKLKPGHWSRIGCRLKTFFYLKLWWSFCSMEQNHFSTFSKVPLNKHSVKLF